MTGERIQKIADSVILRAVARLSMAMALPLASLVVYFGLNWLDGRFEKQETANQNAIAFQVSRIDRIEKAATTAIDQSAKVNDRLTIVETKQVTADATAAKFQNDALTRLDRMQDSMVGISNAVAALSAEAQQTFISKCNEPGVVAMIDARVNGSGASDTATAIASANQSEIGSGALGYGIMGVGVALLISGLFGLSRAKKRG